MGKMVVRSIKVGSQVRVITEHSNYAGLRGKVVEVTQFGDSGMVEFPQAEIDSAYDPPRVRQHLVHFYFRELEQAD